MGVVKLRAASIFRIGMENVFYPEDWHNVVCSPFYKQADLIQLEDTYTKKPMCINKLFFKIMHRRNKRVLDFMKENHELCALCSKCGNCGVTRLIYTVINMS